MVTGAVAVRARGAGLGIGAGAGRAAAEAVAALVVVVTAARGATAAVTGGGTGGGVRGLTGSCSRGRSTGGAGLGRQALVGAWVRPHGAFAWTKPVTSLYSRPAWGHVHGL